MPRRSKRQITTPEFKESQPPEEKKRVLVGTIFAQNDVVQRQWLDLQLSFLEKTTSSYDHIVGLYGNDDSYFKDNTETILLPVCGKNSIAHINGLKFLVDAFQSRAEFYDYFLILDSDALPIRKDWLNFLLSNMSDYHNVAIPIRTENLETRLHASILFAKKSAIHNLKFEIHSVGNDLVGQAECDLSVIKFQKEQRREVFALVRSNKVNVHPVMCGIYYDCFYHHCCGSGRKFNLRSEDYWNKITQPDVEYYTNEIMLNPNSFINQLAGWQPEMYGVI
jgi:hypothetical protein